jgi:hypothetical protein
MHLQIHFFFFSLHVRVSVFRGVACDQPFLATASNPCFLRAVNRMRAAAGALCMGREEAACLHERLCQLPHYFSNVVGAAPGGGWPRRL